MLPGFLLIAGSRSVREITVEGRRGMDLNKQK